MKTFKDSAAAVGHSVNPAGWQITFDEPMARIAGRFGRIEPRRTTWGLPLGSAVEHRAQELLPSHRPAMPLLAQIPTLISKCHWSTKGVDDSSVVRAEGDSAAVRDAQGVQWVRLPMTMKLQ
jgi:hypothetical protein